MTCRLEIHICIGFKQILDEIYPNLILYEVTKENIEHDITIFFQYKCAKIRQERLFSLEWLEEKNIKILVRIKTPFFIFAATIYYFLGKLVGNLQRHLNDILKYKIKDIS